MSDPAQPTQKSALSEGTQKLRAVIAENGQDGWDVAW